MLSKEQSDELDDRANRNTIIRESTLRCYQEYGVKFIAIEDFAARARAIRNLAHRISHDCGCTFNTAEFHVYKLIHKETRS